VTASGKIRKPSGEKEVITFILGKFKPAELAELKKLSKKIGPAIETLVKEGRDKAGSSSARSAFVTRLFN
jgi:peptidyl-tRNA hydrolase